MKNGAGKKLTDFQLRNLKAGPKRYIEWEPHGLGVRVTPKGAKSFVFVYRFGGKLRMMTLHNEAGKTTYPAMTLAEAHEAHRDAQDKLNKGIDPGAKAITEREEEREAPTVAKLADMFRKDYLEDPSRELSSKTIREYSRILKKDVIPAWGDRKVRDITRSDVKALLQPIRKRGPYMHNRTLAAISKLFSYATYNLEIMSSSPCIKIERAPERPRERYLTPEEIKAFWNYLDGAKMSEGIKLALKLQLVTGQRKCEIVGAEWHEVNLTERIWTIPREKAKNKQTHRVALSDFAIQLLQEAQVLAGDDTRWVFPSNVKEDKHIHPESINHALRRQEQVLVKFGPHDLRRTASTLMAGELVGVEENIISKVLNHKKKGVTSIHYNLYSYDREKRQALESWEKALREILEGTISEDTPVPDNVISITRAPGG